MKEQKNFNVVVKTETGSTKIIKVVAYTTSEAIKMVEDAEGKHIQEILDVKFRGFVDDSDTWSDYVQTI